MRFFGRVWKITIFRSNGAALTPAKPGGFVDLNPLAIERENALEITEQDFKASIEKKLEKNPNTCEITIFNLNESHRALLRERPMTVKLEAGHDFVLRHLYLGDIRHAFSELKDATTWETKMILKDGGRAYKGGHLSAAYGARTPVRTILQDAAGSMGLSLPSNLAGVRDLDAGIPRGEAIDGPAHEQLTRLLAPYGYGWSIQNGMLQVLRSDQVRENEAFIVDEETAGLIGSPQYSVPEQEKKPTKLDFKTILWPEMQPGSKVDMRTRSAKGLHKVVALKHELATDGDEWETSCEARQL